MHYLVNNEQECIDQGFWYDFVIKDVTVKQVTSNVTDKVKINIVSSQAALVVSSFSMDTRSMSSSPLVSSLVKNRLFNTAPDIDQPPFQFIHTMDLSVVDTMLHNSPDLVIHRTEIWAVWRPRVERKNVWRFLTQQFNCYHAQHGVPVHCSAGIESRYQTLCISLAAV